MRIDIKFKEKIQMLKDRFKDVMEVDDTVKNQILEWENNLTRLTQISEFTDNPTVQIVQKLLKSRLKDLMIKRATGKGHTPESLKTLEDREIELRYCISLVCPHYEAELGSLEAILDNELAD